MFLNLSTILLIVQDIEVTSVIKLLLHPSIVTLVTGMVWEAAKKRFNGADSGPPLLKSSFIFSEVTFHNARWSLVISVASNQTSQ